MVEEFLSQRGIPFEERDVSRDRAAAEELVRSTGQMGVPVTIIDGQTVIGFDQPRLEEILSEVRAGQRPSFGAMVADAEKITARHGSGVTPGAYVGGVKPSSPAARAGLAEGDIITGINRQRIANADDLARALSGLGKGSHFTIAYIREGRTIASEASL